MKPVLLATDGSPTAEEATTTAIELAEALGSELAIVTVWDIPYGAVGFGAPLPIDGELARLSEEQARSVNAQAAARAEEAGVETHSLVLRGFPAEEICLAVDQLRPRLLVLGSHGWGPIKRTLFGSVSTCVLHRAVCPVLVVRKPLHEEHERGEERAAIRAGR
jgi:nucleotide-binding universal stress UspA family protein